MKFKFDIGIVIPEKKYDCDLRHNVIKILKLLFKCHSIGADYKQMTIRWVYNLDINKPLPTTISESETLTVVKVDSIIPIEYVVLKCETSQSVSNLYMVKKCDTIGFLRNLIEGRPLIFFNRTRLVECKTVAECNLADNSSLKGIKDGKYCFCVTYEQTDRCEKIENFVCDKCKTVDDFRQEIANKFNVHVDKILLFYKKKYLERGKLLYEFVVETCSEKCKCEIRCYPIFNLPNQMTTNEPSKIFPTYDILDVTIHDLVASPTNYTLKKFKCERMNDLDKNIELLSEINTLITVGNHPNIVTFQRFYKDESSFYVAYNKISGIDLRTYRSKNNLENKKYHSIIKQVLYGVVALHSHNISHGNLTIDNIIIDDGNVKLTEFTLSKYISNKEFYFFENSDSYYENSYKDNDKCNIFIKDEEKFHIFVFELLFNQEPNIESSELKQLFEEKFQIQAYLIEDELKTFVLKSLFKSDISALIRLLETSQC